MGNVANNTIIIKNLATIASEIFESIGLSYQKTI